MNIDKNKILIIGLIVFILIGLFPPWIETIQTQKLSYEKPAGYSFILSPPQSYSFVVGYKIDFSRLLIQWIILIGIVLLVVYIKKYKQ